MKVTLQILKATAATLASVSALDLTGVIHIMPDPWSKWAVIIPTAAAAILHTVTALGDILDDGERNNSFLSNS